MNKVNNDVILSVENISKSFRNNLILDKLSFELKQNEIIGLVGESGCGKTTLINIISGSENPDSGDIYHYFNYERKPEEAIFNFNKKLKSKIAISFQKPSFYEELTVLENLFYFSSFIKIPKEERVNELGEKIPKKVIQEDRILKVLKALDMLKSKDMLACNLSGGMKKRLDIACSLLSKPEILILDEPTDSLDFKLRGDFLKLVKRIKKMGVSIIFVSHILEEIAEISDRILFLKNKKIEVLKSRDDLKKYFIKKD